MLQADLMPPRYLLTMIVRMVRHPQSLIVTLLGHPKNAVTISQ
jgi:hypothetical protein